MAYAKRAEKRLRRIALEAHQPEQEVLGGDILVLEVGRCLEGEVEHFGGLVGKTRLGRCSGEFWQVADFSLELQLQVGGLHTGTRQQRHDDAFTILNERGQQVQRHHLGVCVFARQLAGALHRLLRLHG